MGPATIISIEHLMCCRGHSESLLSVAGQDGEKVKACTAHVVWQAEDAAASRQLLEPEFLP